MIAIALACEPKLLIADEPTTALDVTIQAQILELMQDLQKRLGMAIIMVTHDPVAASYADRAIVFADGRIVADVDDPTADQMSDLLMKERELSTRNASNARHAG